MSAEYAPYIPVVASVIAFIAAMLTILSNLVGAARVERLRSRLGDRRFALEKMYDILMQHRYAGDDFRTQSLADINDPAVIARMMGDVGFLVNAVEIFASDRNSQRVHALLAGEEAFRGYVENRSDVLLLAASARRQCMEVLMLEVRGRVR